MLHAWAKDIASEPFSDAVSLETLIETWRHRKRSPPGEASAA
ncbi:hypothetical protein [Amycolatopsis alba]|nr:hypothetical protein [Amycolatopsis alba]